LKRLLLMILLWPAIASAEPPGEAEKTAALREAYRLAGPGVSWGMVDMGVTIVPRTPPEPVSGVVRTVPVTVDKSVANKPVRVAHAAPIERNICTRHHMRKVVTGSSWRCRK
jgi:hypothetical protein